MTGIWKEAPYKAAKILCLCGGIILAFYIINVHITPSSEAGSVPPPEFTLPLPASTFEVNDDEGVFAIIHNPIYGSYPATVNYEPGMTLMPGQTAVVTEILIFEDKNEPTFDDFLDAIEFVESGGVENAVGDYKEVSYSHFENDIVIHCKYAKGKSHKYYDQDSGKYFEAQAIGAYQLHKIYVDDLNIFLDSYYWP